MGGFTLANCVSQIFVSHQFTYWLEKMEVFLVCFMQRVSRTDKLIIRKKTDCCVCRIIIDSTPAEIMHFRTTGWKIKTSHVCGVRAEPNLSEKLICVLSTNPIFPLHLATNSLVCLMISDIFYLFPPFNVTNIPPWNNSVMGNSWWVSFYAKWLIWFDWLGPLCVPKGFKPLYVRCREKNKF